MKTFQSIKYWIFDLDNTLYSAKTKVFDQVEKRMTQYVSDKLNISMDKAKKIQKNYFHEYNTTLNGMIKNHKIDAGEFTKELGDLFYLAENQCVDILQPDVILTCGFRSLLNLASKVKKYGVLFGGVMAIRRILTCHHFSRKMGHDPLQ